MLESQEVKYFASHTHIKFYSNIQSLPTKRGERQFLSFELKTAGALFLVEIYYIYSPGNLPRLNHIRHIAWMQLLVAIFVVTSDAISRDSARRDTIHGPSSDRVHAGLGKTIGPAARIFNKRMPCLPCFWGGSNFGWETVPENLLKNGYASIQIYSSRVLAQSLAPANVLEIGHLVTVITGMHIQGVTGANMGLTGASQGLKHGPCNPCSWPSRGCP